MSKYCATKYVPSSFLAAPLTGPSLSHTSVPISRKEIAAFLLTCLFGWVNQGPQKLPYISVRKIADLRARKSKILVRK